MATIRRKKVTPINADAAVSLALNDVLELAKENDIQDYPLDIKSLIKLFNVNVLSIVMDNEISGYLERKDDGSWVVAANRLHHPRRQRFTLAHEFGHFILHRKRQNKFQDNKLFRNNDQNSMETEANKFAAEILMPAEIFREKAVRSSAGELAEIFGVSMQAVKIRAEKLGVPIQD